MTHAMKLKNADNIASTHSIELEEVRTDPESTQAINFGRTVMIIASHDPISNNKRPKFVPQEGAVDPFTSRAHSERREGVENCERKKKKTGH